jgi:integrase
MPKVDLTDRFCATIKTKANTDYFDAKTTGLGLRVTPTGVKAWSVIYTSPTTGKRARLSLGHYPATPLARARALAIEARGQVEAGQDPRTDDGATDSGMTVSMLAETYLKKHATGLRTSSEIERRMRVDVLPVIGTVKLADLHRRDAFRVIDRLNERGSPVSAEKAFRDLHAMVRWAVERGILDSDPLSGMKAPSASKARERFLTEDEIRLLWQAWPGVFPAPITLALKLALVTGQRIGEILGMTVEEIDFAKAIWTIPAERAKNGFEHTVPLTSMALEPIAEARSKAINGRLFMLDSVRVAQWIMRRRDVLPVKDWTAHDLRRSVCTHLAMMGFSPLVIGSVVNHRQVTKGGVTLAVYVRYDYAKEKREALDMWAERLSAIASGDASKIIPLRSVDAAR